MRGVTRLEASPKVSQGDADDDEQVTSLLEIWCTDHPDVEVTPA